MTGSQKKHENQSDNTAAMLDTWEENKIFEKVPYAFLKILGTPDHVLILKMKDLFRAVKKFLEVQEVMPCIGAFVYHLR